MFIKKNVAVNDKMQKNYCYVLTEPVGRNFALDFKPELTPKQMLELGVFGGKYMTDCQNEFPASWFKRAKLSPEGRNDSLNYFKKRASQPLSVWRKKGWINEKHDPRGWFQWYCRIIWGAVWEKKIDDKLNVGRLLLDTYLKLKKIVAPKI